MLHNDARPRQNVGNWKGSGLITEYINLERQKVQRIFITLIFEYIFSYWIPSIDTDGRDLSFVILAD